MLRIECPYCGARDETEFYCGGEAHIARPEPYDQVSDAEWAGYLFYRNNPAGIQFERWRHAFGCGGWFNVARSTITHEIHAIYPMTEARPDLENS